MHDADKQDDKPKAKVSLRGKAPLPLRAFAKAKDLSWRFARLGVFFTVVGVGVAAAGSYAVANNVREGLLTAGRQMMAYTEHDLDRPRRVMQLNGARLDVMVGTTDHTFREVLDLFERRCAEHSGQLAEQFQEAVSRAQEHGRNPIQETRDRIASHGGRLPDRVEPQVLRRDAQNAGYVACVDMGTSRFDMTTLARRVRSIVSSGNLTELGQLRYAYAERSETGRTRYLTMWTEGELNVRRMFPMVGDAPGQDPANVPRVPGLRRTLAATEEGTNVGMSVYVGMRRRQDVEADVRTLFVRSGWRALRDGAPVMVQGQSMFGFERNETSLAVLVNTDQQGATVLTALASR